MFKEKTLIVLGAGASRHYGFPTGAGLIDDIVKQCLSPIAGLLNDEFPIKDLIRLWKVGKLIQQYDPTSIDRFLTLFKDDQIIATFGKKLIAHNIIKRQRWAAITRENKENWYKFLFDAIFDGVDFEAFLKTDFNLDIITFNYDLSFEYFLKSKLSIIPNLSEENKRAIFDKVYENIHHVYGAVYNFKTILEEYPIRNGRDEFGAIDGFCAAASETYFNETGRFADNIKIIGEEREDDTHTKSLQKITLNAGRIFVLGFGFDDQNIKYIGLDKLPANGRCNRLFCTNYKNNQIISDKIKSIAPTQAKVNISDKSVFEALCVDFSLNYR